MSDTDFERRVERALHAPVPSSARARMAIMESVRRAAKEGMPSRTLIFPGGRAARHSLIGVAIAAGIGSITTLSALAPRAESPAMSGVVTSAVIGDSIVDRFRDTLRLVRLVFDNPAARQVAVIGDFNGWREDATHMKRDERTGKWAVTLALHDGEHRYAIVVDNTRRAGDVRVKAGDATGHVYSLLHVARMSN
ncbi:MAG: glycogen-binding domain-containing protein [bacterium]